MNYSAFDGKKLWTSLVRFAVYMALIIATPFFAKMTSPWFVQISYDQLTPFFVDVVLTLFWLLEIGVVVWVERRIKRKATDNLPQTEEIKDATKKEKKEISVLPLANLLTIVGIIIGCLVVVSLQIGLEVKPFYDMVQRVTSAYAYINNLGPIITAFAKCLWIILILKVALDIGESVFGVINAKKVQGFLCWLFAGLVLFIFGLYDILFFENKYALTYVLFYALFPILYKLANKSDGKYYLIILFIYIF